MRMKEGWDFEGWASKNDLRCEDNRIIRKDAFKVNDGKRVPLVWNHVHDTPGTVLGHAILQNRKEGVYAYCYLNNSEAGQNAKEAIVHGDVDALSIFANQLEQIGNEVLHGVIREVSLVLAGSNPGAFIESVIEHGSPMEDGDEEGIFYTGDQIRFTTKIEHSFDNEGGVIEHTSSDDEKNKEDEDEDDETVGDVIDTLTDKQKAAVGILINQVISDNEEEEDEKEMRHNVFEGGVEVYSGVPKETQTKILSDAKRLSSLKEAVKMNIEEGTLQHASDLDTTGMTVATGNQNYGFNDVSMLLPDYKSLNTPPEFIKREMGWVDRIMSKVHNTPFARVKSVYADITEDEARAKGYIKGKQKKEEVFRTLKRATDPQTIYKKQKLDRDDIIDLSSEFDVVNWLKGEMKMMIREEKARAFLIGDGRPSDSEDKIQEIHIRPVVSDVPLFNTIIKVKVAANATEEVIAKATINSIIRGRKNFKGTGKPDFFTTEDVITEMLLIEDAIGNKTYKTETELSTALRVDQLVPVEPMEGYELEIGGVKYPLIGTMVNFQDYNVGRDTKYDRNQIMEGFDIDYNQYKYLMEDRLSGALIKPFSTVTFVLDKTGA